MIKYIDLTIDFTNRNDRLNGITLDRVTTRSYDTAIKFRIEIIGHALDETYDVKILSKYHKSGLNVMTTLGERLEIVDGKLIYTPKVNLITEADYVRNYLYLSKDGLGLDMAQFNYQVDVSQIGEAIVEVRQVYDESYESLIAEFEQALEDYKLTLPQADSVRAEIDVILNQFGVDGQAKLNQYDADAQQAIADNQTAFGLAETGRQNTYEQAESDRGEVFEQAVTDWEQGAEVAFSGKISEFGTDGNQAITDFNSTSGGILSNIESNESSRLSSEATRKTSETARVNAESTRETSEIDRVSSEATRKTNETTRISNEDARKSAEAIRIDNEDSRVSAESVRAGFYEGFESELGKKANKQQEDWITPTLLNGATGTVQYRKNELGRVELKGKLSNIDGVNCMVLPNSYRPMDNIVIVRQDKGGFYKELTYTNGAIYLTRPYLAGTATVDLNGLSFPTD